MRIKPHKFERAQPLAEKMIYTAAVFLISTLAVLSLVSFF